MSATPNDLAAEYVARKFHEHYERLAPRFDYVTRRRTAVPWEDVPDDDNKALMIATARVLILRGDIVVPSARVSSSGSRATATEGRMNERG